MSVLHINSEYATNSLYKDLLFEIDKGNIEQTNYSSIKSKSQKDENKLYESTIDFAYSKPTKPYHRLLYFRKINYLLKDLKGRVDIGKVKIVHAHKLFSDGGVAYKLYKEYQIPYIVAVRNTDINAFFKYMKHLKCFGREILLNAKRIILISPAYHMELKRILPITYDLIKEKIEVIPNGINDFWFRESEYRIQKNRSELTRFLYVGSFTKNKNIINTIKAVVKLKSNSIKIRIVGDGGNREKAVQYYMRKFPEIVEPYPRANRSELKEHYEASDIFIMPSFKETFGLVYIEALSQGIPIIYSKGQGVDGFFKEGEVGYSVNPYKSESILIAMKKLISNTNDIQKNCVSASKRFNWQLIAKKYIEIYNNLVS